MEVLTREGLGGPYGAKLLEKWEMIISFVCMHTHFYTLRFAIRLHACLQVGSAVTIADVAVAAAVQPLLTGVLSAEARLPYPELVRWFSARLASPEFAKVFGERDSGSGCGDRDQREGHD